MILLLPFSIQSSYYISDTALFLPVDSGVVASIFDRIRTARAIAGVYGRLGGTVWLNIRFVALLSSMFHRVRDSVRLSHVQFRAESYQRCLPWTLSSSM